MYRRGQEQIKTEHLQSNAEGKIDFHSIEVPHGQGYDRLLYFPRNVTFKMFADEIRTLKSEHKRLMVRIPYQLNTFTSWNFTSPNMVERIQTHI